MHLPSLRWGCLIFIDVKSHSWVASATASNAAVLVDGPQSQDGFLVQSSCEISSSETCRLSLSRAINSRTSSKRTWPNLFLEVQELCPNREQMLHMLTVSTAFRSSSGPCSDAKPPTSTSQSDYLTVASLFLFSWLNSRSTHGPGP
jgi:hypothetical protein